MKKYLNAADSRDIDVSKAKEYYEQILLSLRDIERAVEAAKAARQNRAKNLWGEAVKARDVALTQVKNNQDNISNPKAGGIDNQNAVDRFPEMVRLSNVAIGLATDAAREDSSYESNSDDLIKTMNDNNKHAENIKAATSATLAKIETDRFRQMMDERRESRMPK